MQTERGGGMDGDMQAVITINVTHGLGKWAKDHKRSLCVVAGRSEERV